MLKSTILIDRSARGKISLTGSDRASFLHGLLTNDIAALTAGTGVYAAYLTPQGRMISDMRVIETGSRILLDVEPAVAGPLAERLDKLIFSEDAQVHNETERLSLVGIYGPEAAGTIARAAGVDVSGIARQYGNLAAEMAGAELTVVRDDSLGLLGFDIYLAREAAGHLRKALKDAGATEVSEEEAECLRVEAGRPRFGVDMTTDTIPLEAGIEDRAISFTKGCYVGQEVIVRVMHRGHGRVAKRLVGLVLAAGTLPSRGDAILAGQEKIGEVTSAVESPAMNAPIALGYVHRDHVTPGTELSVNGRQARVHALPFRKP